MQELHPQRLRIVAAGRRELSGALAEARAEADALVVFGGDGTAAAAAHACGLSGPPLVILPGGTMNVLSHALYGKRRWPEVLRDALSSPEVRTVSGGLANDRLFVVSAMAGSLASWTRAREHLRSGELVAAWRTAVAALGRTWAGGVRYESFEASGRARIVAIRTPLGSAALDDGADFLELAAIRPKSAAEACRLGLEALIGNWRDDQRVDSLKTRKVRLSRRQGVDLVLDGELAASTARSVTVEFVPRAFRVIAPGPPRTTSAEGACRNAEPVA